jgi:membrane-associated protease RseP (regulator of RpoE activity)
MSQTVERPRKSAFEPADSQADPASIQPVQAAALAAPRRGPGPLTNLVLFVATVITVFQAGTAQVSTEGFDVTWSGLASGQVPIRLLFRGWVFAVPLLSILLAHEFGHYIAARIHRVAASLPFFIPMPIGLFGTMGAVIAMRERITSRRALLDIGAAGPIAGIVVAIPILIWGLLHSEVHVVTGSGLQEGQSLLYLLLKRVTVGPIPEGSDVFLHPAALAGWTGLFITMLNLIPVGQLDGGHIAYALMQDRAHTLAKVVHRGLLPLMLAINVGIKIAQALSTTSVDLFALPPGQMAAQGALLLLGSLLDIWAVWFLVLLFLGKKHPPTEAGQLGPVRKAIAIGCLVLFVLLFMPTPLAAY